MRRRNRMEAVMRAIETWKESEWFVASEILSRSNKLSTQPRGGLNVYCVSRHLKTLEGRGLIESDGFQNGRKRYRRL